MSTTEDPPPSFTPTFWPWFWIVMAVGGVIEAWIVWLAVTW